jgi:hypothetical protein
MDFDKPQTVAEALNGVDKLFWLMLSRHNATGEPTISGYDGLLLDIIIIDYQLG